MKGNKKGQALDMLTKLMVGVASITIILVVTFLILAQAQNQIVTTDGITDEANQSALSVGYNASVTITNAVGGIPAWLPLIIVASIGAALLGIVGLFKRR